MVRYNCEYTVIPATWIAVDEAMVYFEGHSLHTVKLPYKPIREGIKIWVLAFDCGYVFTWLFYSHLRGPESIGIVYNEWFNQMVPLKAVKLAAIKVVPVRLCQRLKALFPGQHYLVFLNNLFLSVLVTEVLLNIGVAIISTIREDVMLVSKELIALKK